MQGKTKSAAVAGVLGMLFGWVGVHDWYLGKTKQAIRRICVTVVGVVILVAGLVIRMLTEGTSWLYTLSTVLIIVAYVILVGNFVVGFIGGIITLMRGNVGLAAQGYNVASSMQMNVAGSQQATDIQQMTAAPINSQLTVLESAGVQPVDSETAGLQPVTPLQNSAVEQPTSAVGQTNAIVEQPVVTGQIAADEQPATAQGVPVVNTGVEGQPVVPAAGEGQPAGNAMNAGAVSVSSENASEQNSMNTPVGQN